jgi:hypothetical protein
MGYVAQGAVAFRTGQPAPRLTARRRIKRPRFTRPVSPRKPVYGGPPKVKALPRPTPTWWRPFGPKPKDPGRPRVEFLPAAPRKGKAGIAVLEPATPPEVTKEPVLPPAAAPAAVAPPPPPAAAAPVMTMPTVREHRPVLPEMEFDEELPPAPAAPAKKPFPTTLVLVGAGAAALIGYFVFFRGK